MFCLTFFLYRAGNETIDTVFFLCIRNTTPTEQYANNTILTKQQTLATTSPTQV